MRLVDRVEDMLSGEEENKEPDQNLQAISLDFEDSKVEGSFFFQPIYLHINETVTNPCEFQKIVLLETKMLR